MSDIDALVKAAEGRVAKSGRSALMRARAENRLSQLVEATAASAARAPRASSWRSWRWLTSGGAIVLAGAVLTSAFTRTSSPSPAAAPRAVETPPESTPPLVVTVDSLPSVPEQAPPSPVASAAVARPHVAAVASSIQVGIVRPSPHGTAAPLPGSSQTTPPSTESESESPAALFERANNARRSNDYVSAEKLYQHLLDLHPGSREAATSRVVLGRMLLSRGSADAALPLFDRYLAESPKAALAEQALVGRAQCLQRLQRREEERAAWRLLLDSFPGSPNQTEAVERLR